MNKEYRLDHWVCRLTSLCGLDCSGPNGKHVYIPPDPESPIRKARIMVLPKYIRESKMFAKMILDQGLCYRRLKKAVKEVRTRVEVIE